MIYENQIEREQYSLRPYLKEMDQIDQLLSRRSINY